MIKTNQWHGTLSAIDRTDGSVVVKLNVPHSGAAPTAGRTFAYAGPIHPFRMAERIYANVSEMLGASTAHVHAIG